MPPQLDELLARVDQCSTQAIELSTHFQELREQIRQAIDIAQRDPEMSLIRSRKVLEYIVVDIYDDALKPKRAGTQPLENLVQTLVKEGQFPNRLAAYADMVRGLGNVGAHSREKGVSSQDVLNSLSSLLPIVEWFFEQRKMPGAVVAPPAATVPNGSAAVTPPRVEPSALPATREPKPQTATGDPQPAEKSTPVPPPLPPARQRTPVAARPSEVQPVAERPARPVPQQRQLSPGRDASAAKPAVAPARRGQNPAPATTPVTAPVPSSGPAADSRPVQTKLWAIGAGSVALAALGIIWHFMGHHSSADKLATTSGPPVTMNVPEKSVVEVKSGPTADAISPAAPAPIHTTAAATQEPASDPFGAPAASPAAAAPGLITNSIGMKLTLIPAGDFMMGSPDDEPHASSRERPQHNVRITKPFYLGMYIVTRGQFAKFVAATKYKTDAETNGKGGSGYTGDDKEPFPQKPEFTWRNTGFPQTGEHPVVNVSWNDAVAFCKWLSDQEGKTYRLPTEAEWEYACRAGTTTAYFFGGNPEDLAKYANVADATFKERFKEMIAGAMKQDPALKFKTIETSDGYVFTAPVGSFQPNPFGLYDMLGNAWQWCSDWVGADYYKASPPADPQGPDDSNVRAQRGGSWSDSPAECRCSYRGFNPPEYSCCNIGFRVARQLADGGGGSNVQRPSGAKASVDAQPATVESVPPKVSDATTNPLETPITNSIGMTLTPIPAGEFMMGSPDKEPGADTDEHPRRSVRITKPFYLGTYSVTRGEFGKFVAAMNYKTDAESDGKGGWGFTGDGKFAQKPEITWRNPGFPQTDQHPVVNVSWNDAVAFCKWLSDKEGKTYRLPTEAEWEYACRAGATSAYFFGDDPSDLGSYAWFSENSDDATHEVGQKRPNRFGLYDMLGDAWQLCSDRDGADYYKNSPLADPQGPAAGTGRVRRGGSWNDTPAHCRCSSRGYFQPESRSCFSGFRVVREP